MLQLMRDNLNSWITKIIIGIICFAFTIWGLETLVMPDQTGTQTITQVNSEPITQQQYQRMLQSIQYRSIQNKQNLSTSEIHKMAMKELINQALLIDFAKKNNLAISNNELEQRLAKTEAFQENGRFNKVKFIEVLRRAGFTPALFKENLKQDLLIEQIQSGISQSAFMTNHQLEQFLKLENQKRDIKWAVLDTIKHKNKQSVTPLEIETYYESSKDKFMTPNQVSVNYVLLKRTDLMKNIEVSGEKIDSAYREYVRFQKDSYKPEYEKIELNFTDETRESQIKLTKKILEDLKKGTAFKALIKKHSHDKKGRIDALDTDLYDKTIVQAAEKLEPGSISNVIEFEKKLFILNRTDSGKPIIESLESKRDTLQKQIQDQESNLLFEQQSQLIADLSFEAPDLTEPAKKLNLTIQSTPLLTLENKNRQGLTTHPNFIKAAFSEEVVSQGHNSDLVILTPGQEVAVLHLKHHKPTRQKELNEVNLEIKEQLLKTKILTSLKQEANQIIEHLRQGKSFEELDKTQTLNWKVKTKVGRHEKEVPEQVIEQAFKLPNPTQTETRSIARVELPDNEIAIVLLNEIIWENDEKTEDSLKNLFSFALSRTQGQLDYQEFLTQLHKNADIEHKIKMDATL